MAWQSFQSKIVSEGVSTCLNHNDLLRKAKSNQINPIPFCSPRQLRQTSLNAYSIAKEKLGQHQHAVLNAIRLLGEATDKEISRTLNWPINCITPRRLELLRLGLVEECGIKYQENRPSTMWKCV